MTSSARRFSVTSYSSFVLLSGITGKIFVTGYLLILQSMDQSANLDLLHTAFLPDCSLLLGYMSFGIEAPEEFT